MPARRLLMRKIREILINDNCSCRSPRRRSVGRGGGRETCVTARFLAVGTGWSRMPGSAIAQEADGRKDAGAAGLAKQSAAAASISPHSFSRQLAATSVPTTPAGGVLPERQTRSGKPCERLDAAPLGGVVLLRRPSRRAVLPCPSTGKAEALVEEFVGMIERGELRLPKTQRRYVWRSTRVRDFRDSLYHGYPSGAILL